MKCVNQDTMQRAFDTFGVCFGDVSRAWKLMCFEIPSDILPEEVKTEKEGLKIKCESCPTSYS